MALDLGTAWIQISPSMKGVRAAVEKEFNGVNVSSLTSGISGAFSTVAKVGGAAIATVGAAVTGLALKGGIQRALSIEGAQAKLTGLGHDAASVSEIMKSALDSVKGTAFGLGDAATVAASLSAAGVQSGEYMTAVLKTVADTAEISGRSLTDIGTIFGSVAAKGKLDGGDLLQLTSSGVPVLQFLSEQLGVTTADVSGMVSSGKIDFETFASAMQAGLGGAALSAGETFSGAIANVQAALSRLGAAGATPALDAIRVVAVALIPVIDGLTTALQPLFASFGESTAAGAERLAGLLGRVGDGLASMGQIDLSGITGALSGLAPVVGAAVAPLLSNLPMVGAIFKDLTGPVGLVIGLFSSMVSGSAPLRDAFGQLAQAVGPAVVDIFRVISDVATQLGAAFGQVGDAIAPVIAAIAAQLPGVIDALVPALSAVLGTLPTLVSVGADLATSVLPLIVAAIPVVADVLNAILPVIQSIATWISDNTGLLGTLMAGLAAGLTAMKAVSGVTSIITTVTAVVGKLGLAIKAVSAAMAANPVGLAIAAIAALVAGLIWAYNNVEPFRNLVNNVFAAIKNAIGAVVDWVTGTVIPAFQAAWDAIGNAISWLNDNIIQPVWTAIKTAIAVAVTAVIVIFEFWKTILETVLAPIFDWLWHSVIEPVWNGIQTAINAVVDWFQNTAYPIFQTVVTAISDAFAWVRDRIGEAWAWIRDTIIQPVIDWLVGVVVMTFSTWRDIIVGVFNSVRDGIGAAWDWIRNNIIQPVVDWFNSTIVPAFTSIKDNIVGAFEAVRDGISNAWNAIKELAAEPVRFVVNTVVAGLVETYNGVAEKFGAATATVPHVAFDEGGLTRDAQIGSRPILWGEAGPEAYIPLSPSKRGRSVNIWAQTGQILGVLPMEDGGILGNIGSAISGFLSDPAGFLLGKISGLMDAMSDNAFVQILKGIPGNIADMIAAWFKDHIASLFTVPGGGPVSGAFDDWWGAAIAINPAMAPFKAIAATVAQYESGFNPTVVNNWDSNAAAGTPSAGLMQFIQPTFAAYQWPGFSNWLGPVDQLLAWWNYVNARYGGPMNIPGIVGLASGTGYVGYAKGTANARRGLAWVGENGPELVNFSGGERVWDADESVGLGRSTTIVFSPTYKADDRSVRRDLEDLIAEMKLRLVHV